MFLQMENLIKLYVGSSQVRKIAEALSVSRQAHLKLKGLSGSLPAVLGASLFLKTEQTQFFVISDKESAAYFYNDLETLLGEKDLEMDKKQVLFFPVSYKQAYQIEETDNANMLLRADILNRLNDNLPPKLIVTYPEAVSEKVISGKSLAKNTLRINIGEVLSDDFLIDVFSEYDFERVDFVVEPGQYAFRGGIIDVFSFANEYPFRIELFGDMVESLRSFDVVTQLSKENYESISILPNIKSEKIELQEKVCLIDYLPQNTVLWFDNLGFFLDKLDKEFDKAQQKFNNLNTTIQQLPPEKLFTTSEETARLLSLFTTIELQNSNFFKQTQLLEFSSVPQPAFNKHFELLMSELEKYTELSYLNFICVENTKQATRLEQIFSDLSEKEKKNIQYSILDLSLSEGFIDTDEKVLCFTDHQIFERYHRYKIRTQDEQRQALTLKDVFTLSPGDFVTHIDHGVGRFGGLEKIENNGKIQEAIRLVYKDNDIMYVSIHSLHRISRYIGKEGAVPTLNRLGSNTWQVLKNKTKQKVKDIAKDLIRLYAKRKESKGFAFSADSYLQNELEASFIYEDTPDQFKTTQDVKRDMESVAPMDRLVCGDVGFGKTEIAIRAAFKAVADSKQVAILVPTTILAFQHYNTLSDRLKDFPCRVEYLNRFKTAKEKKKILEDVEAGKIDVLIGTHIIASKNMKFKDLGLLIIDEEQKFGVSVKERLKELKVNVDTLTLTATPIPRTLQFSLMGARDLSVINTPPPNRYPIQTELHNFNEEIIRDAILFELSRGGQVYFINNRIQNLMELAGLLKRLLPDATVAVAHGQMEGEKLEEILMDFIDGNYDILLSTAIVENGLDIPNANTIIVNDAQHFGLSELHQLRGRVGRSNKKSFCFLLTPPLSLLTPEARKRLKAIEEFSDIGSGFNIAMRDLDIRGAGNILGAEQSGFISEIGFDMYQKILNEALDELKETEFKGLYEQDAAEKTQFVKECVIETDLEILIPDSYVTNITERLILYKELDALETDEDLEIYKSKLTDRFGPIPNETSELVETIKLRRTAKEIGFEKLVLKQNKLVGFFISNQESEYYNSEYFTKVLQFVQTYPNLCQMKEGKEKLTLSFAKIDSVQKALEVLRKIVEI